MKRSAGGWRLEWQLRSRLSKYYLVFMWWKNMEWRCLLLNDTILYQSKDSLSWPPCRMEILYLRAPPGTTTTSNPRCIGSFGAITSSTKSTYACWNTSKRTLKRKMEIPLAIGRSLELARTNSQRLIRNSGHLCLLLLPIPIPISLFPYFLSPISLAHRPLIHNQNHNE